jgi:hypothetical protein
MTEERPDGCKSYVSGLCAVLPFRLEVVQEGEDKIAVEIGDRQRAGFALPTLGGEQDQQVQPVASWRWSSRSRCVALGGDEWRDALRETTL